MLLFTGIAMLFGIIFPGRPAIATDRLPVTINPAITMDTTNDSLQLSAINAKFINNFLTRDVASHDAIIHRDFVCIQGDGSIISRETYLKNWATDFDNSGYLTFTYTDEHIRIFADIALVRSKTILPNRSMERPLPVIRSIRIPIKKKTGTGNVSRCRSPR